MPYDVGGSVPIAWDVFDAAGVASDAVGVTLTVTKPDGTTETPAVTNPPSVTGRYRVTYLPATEGRYLWSAVTTSPNTAYQEAFTVRGASPSILSLADAKQHLNITTSNNDDELRDHLEATTRIVEDEVGPIVRRTHTARVCGGRSRIPLPHTQVREIASVTEVRSGTSVDVSGMTVNQASGVLSYLNGASFLYDDMDVTYEVGRDAVEASWTLAAKIIVKHMWLTQLGNLPSGQGDDRGYVVTGSGYLVPYRAISLLKPDQVAVGFA
jgi:hypothetical protein